MRTLLFPLWVQASMGWAQANVDKPQGALGLLLRGPWAYSSVVLDQRPIVY